SAAVTVAPPAVPGADVESGAAPLLHPDSARARTTMPLVQDDMLVIRSPFASLMPSAGGLAMMSEADLSETDTIRLHLQSQHRYGPDRFRKAIESGFGQTVGPQRLGQPRCESESPLCSQLLAPATLRPFQFSHSDPCFPSGFFVLAARTAACIAPSVALPAGNSNTLLSTRVWMRSPLVNVTWRNATLSVHER